MNVELRPSPGGVERVDISTLPLSSRDKLLRAPHIPVRLAFVKGWYDWGVLRYRHPPGQRGWAVDGSLVLLDPGLIVLVTTALSGRGLFCSLAVLFRSLTCVVILIVAVKSSTTGSNISGAEASSEKSSCMLACLFHLLLCVIQHLEWRLKSS